MQNDRINLLVTFDKNYIKPFQTMLMSLLNNNPREILHVWLLHSAIPQEELQALEEYCSLHCVPLTPLQIDRAMFQNAPISKRYPQEMYYRLLAPHLLPVSVEKILYLDPDILVINPIRPLWEMGLNGNAFAAASHTGITEIMNDINRVRLGTEHDYYNTGVMLMDLTKAREIVRPDDIFQCVSEHETDLLLPDQDVFNYLYGQNTLQVDDTIWNYDARYYSNYLIRSGGICNLEWVIQNTAVLHFCGKRKPWGASYSQRFGALYKHYMQAAAR
ncbi:MAG: glycosyltransferase family 8 protein [Hungatella sp.]|jgi:lipopolysaccharide biosynthesis glycosyltransferase|nr:glycosyltransferase family 8 protein [Hungatella sp.]